MLETIVLGGGCFWCTESVFQSIRGVERVMPGYSGGHVESPSYEQVCGEKTGHIEVVQVHFDPQVVSLEQLLRIFFATHDPTTLDRQGGDVGPQYASAIFCENARQRQVAETIIQDIQTRLATPVVTKVLDIQKVWPAESLHHDYYLNNPYQGYCQAVIAPKLKKLRYNFSELLK